MFSGASVAINGGTIYSATNMNIIQSKRGIDILVDWIATDAFHNSKELYDVPKCHPHTREAVLTEIMTWVIESKAQDEFMQWLFGPAGAGKSAIAKKIAELAAEKGLLIGSFFFSRTSPTRNTQDRLVATLAYQMTVSIPGTRNHIEDAIEQDPAIFHKDVQTQIDTLLMAPFQSASTQTIPLPKLIVIDGLDECKDSQAQVAILNAISLCFTRHKLPIVCLVASRPETDLVAAFNGKKPLKTIHRRLALDDTYLPYTDIRRFFFDKFQEIQCNHRLRSTIPKPWPTQKSFDALVWKSSGQFIFAATVVRFVESNRHRPAERLNIILGISPPGPINPFTELDAVYKQILSSVEDIQLTLHVLSLYASSPLFATRLRRRSVEPFLSLEKGDIDRALIDLSSLVSYNESSGTVKFLHASFVDFLSDNCRSDEFYIDMESACIDFLCRTFQYVKGPDGIRAGDRDTFEAGIRIRRRWILNGQLRNAVVNFDFDAFITAATISPYSRRSNSISKTFTLWMTFISEMGLEDRDAQLQMRRCRNSFESRIQKYQSDRRLRLLLTLATVMVPFYDRLGQNNKVPVYKRLDILLEMDDEELHLVDQDALDLRYSPDYFATLSSTEMQGVISRYVDGDKYTSAALHCLRFLFDSKTLKYLEAGRNGSSEVDAKWKATCEMALDLLCGLLDRANTSPELIKYLTEYYTHPVVREILPVGNVEAHIRVFLTRLPGMYRGPTREIFHLENIL